MEKSSNVHTEKVVNLVEIIPFPIIASTSALKFNYPNVNLDEVHKNNAIAYCGKGRLISYKVRNLPIDNDENIQVITDVFLKPGPIPKLYGEVNPRPHTVYTELLCKLNTMEASKWSNASIFKTQNIAILISDHSQCVFGRDYLPLAKSFADNGLIYKEVLWTDENVDWKQFDAVVVRSTCDYFESPKKHNQFVKTISKIEQFRIPVFNNADTILWNSTKDYLKELECVGIKIPETIWIKGSEVKSTVLQLPQDWSDIVVKPAISTGGFRTFRFLNKNIEKFEENIFDSNETVMIQKTVPEILSEGEWSFVFFNGNYSHSILKATKKGEFKVQGFRGGKTLEVTPENWMIQKTRKILESIKQLDSLYARVDVVRQNNDLMVMEIELIEPDLYWGVSPQAADFFAFSLKNKILSYVK